MGRCQATIDKYFIEVFNHLMLDDNANKDDDENSFLKFKSPDIVP